MALAIALVAVLATPAAASDHLMIVSEVQLSEGGDSLRSDAKRVAPAAVIGVGGPWGRDPPDRIRVRPS